jgi:hypothetical protein
MLKKFSRIKFLFIESLKIARKFELEQNAVFKSNFEIAIFLPFKFQRKFLREISIFFPWIVSFFFSNCLHIFQARGFTGSNSQKAFKWQTLFKRRFMASQQQQQQQTKKIPFGTVCIFLFLVRLDNNWVFSTAAADSFFLHLEKKNICLLSSKNVTIFTLLPFFLSSPIFKENYSCFWMYFECTNLMGGVGILTINFDNSKVIMFDS